MPGISHDVQDHHIPRYHESMVWVDGPPWMCTGFSHRGTGPLYRLAPFRRGLPDRPTLRSGVDPGSDPLDLGSTPDPRSTGDRDPQIPEIPRISSVRSCEILIIPRSAGSHFLQNGEKENSNEMEENHRRESSRNHEMMISTSLRLFLHP